MRPASPCSTSSSGEMFKSYGRFNFYIVGKVIAEAVYPAREKYVERYCEILETILHMDRQCREKCDVQKLLDFLK